MLNLRPSSAMMNSKFGSNQSRPQTMSQQVNTQKPTRPPMMSHPPMMGNPSANVSPATPMPQSPMSPNSGGIGPSQGLMGGMMGGMFAKPTNQVPMGPNGPVSGPSGMPMQDLWSNYNKMMGLAPSSMPTGNLFY